MHKLFRLSFPGETLDVNVHPTKMELRFDNNQEIYKELCDALYAVLSHKELIPEVPVEEKKVKPVPIPVYREPIPEPFEKRRINEIRQTSDISYQKRPEKPEFVREQPEPIVKKEESVQVTLESVAPDFMTEDARKNYHIIGQLFKTYWLIEYEDKLYIMDQHAAHEKVLYERTMAKLKEKEFTSQAISPPILLSLDAKEEEMLQKYMEQITRLGYEIENFGGREYMISAVPDNLYHIDMKDLFIEMLDDFSNMSGNQTPDLILEKVASMSCKAAVKGNDRLSLPEINALIDELLTLENPFNCPHGRPTIISMSKYEIEKKFKRIV